MHYRPSIHRKLWRRALSAYLGSLLLSSLGTARAFALGTARAFAQQTNSQQTGFQQTISQQTGSQQTVTAPDPLTLEALLDAVNARPENSVPLSAQEYQPVFERSVEQPLRLLLRLSDRKVYVYRGDTVEASYPVAIGRPGWETPTGEFEVFSQIIEPRWMNPLTNEVIPPGPNNPLGDRWIAFWTDGINSIGFHGTPHRESIGKAASHGCIRMYNEDVRALYEIVAIGTPVVVEP